MCFSLPLAHGFMSNYKWQQDKHHEIKEFVIFFLKEKIVG